jgi:hypothetical protein
MKFYRIKEIGENQFIPQQCDGICDWLVCFCKGIQVDNKMITTWYSKEYQDMYCIVKSLEEAKEVIGKYQAMYNIQKQYPKYHKL